jgi:hypothetical protein
VWSAVVEDCEGGFCLNIVGLGNEGECKRDKKGHADEEGRS